MRDLKSLGLRLIFCLAILVPPALVAAGEVPEAVRVACSDDYQKYCIKHQPGSEAGRECMADVFEKLTETCVSAIMNSDLVGEEPTPEASESTVAGTATPPVPARRVAEKRQTRKTRTAQKARKKRHARTVSRSRSKRRVRTARRASPYRVRQQRHASRRVWHRRTASRGDRVVNRIWRGKRIAARSVSRALRRAFWY